MPDNDGDKIERSQKVYKSLRGIRKRPVDIFIKIANVLKVSADVLLVDVLSVSGAIKATYLETSISRLSEKEQKKVYEILEILTRDA